MESIYYFPAAFFGFFIGLLVWPRLVRWVYAIFLAVKARGKPNLDQPGALPVVFLFINAGPCLIAVIVFLAVHILFAPHHPAWNWVFGGMVMGPLISVPLSFLMLRRAKNRAIRRAPP